MKRILTAVTMIMLVCILAVTASAVTMYAADGRTTEVTQDKVEAYKKVGWYEGETMYAADGRTVAVSPFKVEDYKKVGWYEGVTMYAADGRSVKVSPFKEAAYKSVGWYSEVTMYAADGRTTKINPFKVEAYKKVGWYTEPVVVMYAADGRTTYVLTSKVAAYKAVGWYEGVTLYSVDGRTTNASPFKIEAYKAVGWYTERPKVYPSSLTMSSSLSLVVGNQSTLAVTYAPAYTNMKNLTWTSSNPGVAAVNGNGVVTAVNAGSAIITAKAENGVSAICNVSVAQKPLVGAPISSQLNKYGKALGFFTNSADGIKVYWEAPNISGKTINYYTCHFEMYNSVGDPAYDQITHDYKVSKKYVGPVAPNNNLIVYTVVGYSGVCYKIKLTRIDLEFSDGTKATYNYNMVGYEDLWDKYNNNWLR